jgi:hypothetical protein
MATYSEQLLADLQEARTKLAELFSRDYLPHEVTEIVGHIGPKVELFLKASVFPSKSARNTLESFINELLNHGIPQEDVDVLHNLRRTYNGAKHDPSLILNLLDVTKLLDQVIKVINKVASLNLGISNTLLRREHKRVFWVAVWDHFIHGDSEVQSYIPSMSADTVHPPLLDLIYIDIQAWDDVNKELGSAGKFISGKDFMPAEVYKSFTEDWDSLGAFIFEGHYRSLITVLASHELRQEDLLPFLQRHNNPNFMLQAFILATGDVAPTTDRLEVEEVSEQIQDQAVAVYAVPEEFQEKLKYATGMASMLSKIDRSRWTEISGPTWVTGTQFDEYREGALAIHETHYILVDADCVIRVRSQP